MVEKPKSPLPTPEVNLIVALMEQIEGLRSDLRAQTDSINRKLDAQDLKSDAQDLKFDAQAKETRGEFSDLRSEVSDVKTRLAEGSERMKNLRRDVDSAKVKCEGHHSIATVALQRKDDASGARRPEKKHSPPWWVALFLGGALAFVGDRAAKFLINGIADSPVATASPPPSHRP